MKQLYVSASAEPALTEWLEEQGYSVVPFSTSGIVAEPVSEHPDMFMCRLGIGDDSELVSYFVQNDIRLSAEYPHDIAYNAACTGKFFIHNLKYTAPSLLTRAKELGMTLVDVKQGYSKCSTVIVDENSIITYDLGIAAACRKAGMDVLTVQPGHVVLPGYDTGFIGGASGRIGDTIVFNGDLSAHPSFKGIEEFIAASGLDIKWFPDWPLTDIGSMIQGASLTGDIR